MARPEEEWARQMVQAALGVPVVHHDDGSEPGMFDLLVHLSENRRAAVEVTAAADPDCTALWKLMNGDDDRWVEDDLQGGWMVGLIPKARAKRVRAELPDLLRLLERENVPGLRHPRPHRSEIEALAADLGVATLFQSATTDFPGSIYVTIEEDLDHRGGWVDDSPISFVEWVSTFLASAELADVRRKLAASGHAERHAFLLVPGFTTAPFGVANLLMGHGTPIEPPSLPDEITHVWLASTWTVGTGWRWDTESGWQPFDKLQDRDEAAS
jgi:hypothetical protein